MFHTATPNRMSTQGGGNASYFDFFFLPSNSLGMEAETVRINDSCSRCLVSAPACVTGAQAALGMSSVKLLAGVTPASCALLQVRCVHRSGGHCDFTPPRSPCSLRVESACYPLVLAMEHRMGALRPEPDSGCSCRMQGRTIRHCLQIVWELIKL